MAKAAGRKLSIIHKERLRARSQEDEVQRRKAKRRAIKERLIESRLMIASEKKRSQIVMAKKKQREKERKPFEKDSDKVTQERVRLIKTIKDQKELALIFGYVRLNLIMEYDMNIPREIIEYIVLYRYFLTKPERKELKRKKAIAEKKREIKRKMEEKKRRIRLERKREEQRKRAEEERVRQKLIRARNKKIDDRIKLQIKPLIQRFNEMNERLKRIEDLMVNNYIHGQDHMILMDDDNEQKETASSRRSRMNEVVKYDINKDEFIDFKVWLMNKVKLAEYMDLFIKHGCDRLSVVVLLDKNALKEIGIDKIGHQLLILSEIDKLKKLSLCNNQYFFR